MTLNELLLQHVLYRGSHMPMQEASRAFDSYDLVVFSNLELNDTLTSCSACCWRKIAIV